MATKTPVPNPNPPNPNPPNPNPPERYPRATYAKNPDSFPATTPTALATGLSKVASGVADFEAKFKADFADLSATAKGLIQQALAVAESEGSVIAGALKGAVATVKGTGPGK